MDFDSRSPVVVLAGGTGGAKLARGMVDVAGDDLVVIANTGDDVELYGAYVAPDPDLVSFHLADRIDPRGWGLDGDTFLHIVANEDDRDVLPSTPAFQEFQRELTDRMIPGSLTRTTATMVGAYRVAAAQATATAD